MEHNTTETDQILKRQKLEAMKANLERIIRNIDSELQKTPK
jgi:hypothetical protein